MDEAGDSAVALASAAGASDLQLSRFKAEQLASAFELSAADVMADAPTIVHWDGSARDLYGWLNVRHAWRTNEAFHYVKWVRVSAWQARTSLDR